MRVLVADDDRVNRRRLEAFLAKWNYEVVLAGDGAEAWKILEQENAPRLAILDWMMPGMDGAQICREVRKRNPQPYVYILLLTAKFQKQDIVTGLEAGADDYLLKPFDANELKARLRTGKRILELQQQLLSARDALQFQATHDSLTGLWNRAAILETARVELIRARRQRSSVGFIMADLDHFKQVNDTYGHLAGDAVLQETARKMGSTMRAYDAVGRYGGEEFLIVTPGSDLPTAANLAERLRRRIEEEPLHAPTGKIAVTLSLGATATGKEPSPETEPLLRAADEALYRAKENGRNRVERAAENPAASPAQPEDCWNAESGSPAGAGNPGHRGRD